MVLWFYGFIDRELYQEFVIGQIKTRKESSPFKRSTRLKDYISAPRLYQVFSRIRYKSRVRSIVCLTYPRSCTSVVIDEEDSIIIRSKLHCPSSW